MSLSNLINWLNGEKPKSKIEKYVPKPKGRMITHGDNGFPLKKPFYQEFNQEIVMERDTYNPL